MESTLKKTIGKSLRDSGMPRDEVCEWEWERHMWTTKSQTRCEQKHFQKGSILTET